MLSLFYSFILHIFGLVSCAGILVLNTEIPKVICVLGI